ncbi:MAG TPA: cupredoxin domain-containing protein [Actinomycetota bacterium]|nr:cupredoxin domain-containing protein [Actinomycetota bacterium]
MSRRTLGAILLALGLGGLVVTGAGWWGPPVAWHRTMHGWMHGGQVAVAPAPPLPGAPELEVTARDLAFSPAEPSVTAGETVNVVLRNEGAAFHDLAIPTLGFRLEAGPGETAAASLTVPTPGRYRFLCTVPGHAEAGMTGTLVAR